MVSVILVINFSAIVGCCCGVWPSTASKHCSDIVWTRMVLCWITFHGVGYEQMVGRWSKEIAQAKNDEICCLHDYGLPTTTSLLTCPGPAGNLYHEDQFMTCYRSTKYLMAGNSILKKCFLVNLRLFHTWFRNVTKEHAHSCHFLHVIILFPYSLSYLSVRILLAS